MAGFQTATASVKKEGELAGVMGVVSQGFIGGLPQQQQANVRPESSSTSDAASLCSETA